MPKYDMNEWNKLISRIRNNDATLTSLDLSGSYIDDESVKALSDALEENTRVTFINLHSNYIDDDGIKSLINTLMINKTLAGINLRNNSFSSEGIKELSKALKENTMPFLTSINISCNNIDDDDIEILSDALSVNMTLTSIDLSESHIDNEGFKKFSDALKKNNSLTHVIFNSNDIDDEGFKAFKLVLEENKTLTSIDLICKNISDTSKKELNNALKVNALLKDSQQVKSELLTLVEQQMEGKLLEQRQLVEFIENNRCIHEKLQTETMNHLKAELEVRGIETEALKKQLQVLADKQDTVKTEHIDRINLLHTQVEGVGTKAQQAEQLAIEITNDPNIQAVIREYIMKESLLKERERLMEKICMKNFYTTLRKNLETRFYSDWIASAGKLAREDTSLQKATSVGASIVSSLVGMITIPIPGGGALANVLSSLTSFVIEEAVGKYVGRQQDQQTENATGDLISTDDISAIADKLARLISNNFYNILDALPDEQAESTKEAGQEIAKFVYEQYEKGVLKGNSDPIAQLISLINTALQLPAGEIANVCGILRGDLPEQTSQATRWGCSFWCKPRQSQPSTISAGTASNNRQSLRCNII